MSALYIPRWEHYVNRMVLNSEGPYIKYADHVAALSAAVADARQTAFLDGQDKEREMSAPGVDNAYHKGVSDEKARIRKAVKALFPLPDVPQPIRGESVLAVIDNEEGR